MRVACLLLVVLIACQAAPQKVNIQEQPLAKPVDSAAVLFFTSTSKDIDKTSKLFLQINEIGVYSETKGWTQTSTQAEIDLMLEQPKLITQLVIPSGKYSKIKLKTNTLEEWIIPVDFELTKNGILNLNFVISESIYGTKDQKFLPRIQIEYSTADDVIVTSDRKLKIKNQQNIFTKKIGMDIQGNFDENPNTNFVSEKTLTNPKTAIEQPILDKKYSVTVFAQSMSPNTIKTNTRTRIILTIKNMDEEFELSILNTTSRIYFHKETTVTFQPENPGDYEIICDCNGQNKPIGIIKVYDVV